MAPITPQWLDQTFTSRTQAETILRPYLDVGTITDHDYNLAVSFLPGTHRYWPVRLMRARRVVFADDQQSQAAYSAGATVLTVAYGRYARTPKWTSRRTWAFGIAANVLGLFVGQVKRASAHAQFVKSLDNQPGFLSALHEIAGNKLPRPGGAAVDPARPPEGTEEYGSKVIPNDADSAWATADQPQIATRTASGRFCFDHSIPRPMFTLFSANRDSSALQSVGRNPKCKCPWRQAVIVGRAAPRA